MLNFKFNRGELEGSLASPKKIRNKKERICGKKISCILVRTTLRTEGLTQTRGVI